jgi:enoyl-CoA hydratase/3-hydroxyacyl-CoA dehydrogenase
MTVDDIETIAVLGAGNMGHGIAEVAALAGYEVTMRDINDELVQDGYDNIEWSLNKLAEKDRISQDEADAALARVEPVVDLDVAVGDADVVIEAVPEKMEIKREVYEEIDDHAPNDAIFATNTSSLSITNLSEVTDRPEQFCGMHFFNPPVRMALVEVIRGGRTSDETMDTVEALAEDFDKEPVRVRKDSPGFIVNRVLVPLMNEGAWLVHEDYATVAEVDSTTKFDMGHPMGLFELSDQVGLDVGYHVLQYLKETLGEAYEPCPWTKEMVENEKFGKKTGEGVYDYDDGGVDIPPDEGREDVANVLNAIMANEVGKLRQDDVAPIEDIDRAMKLGAGYSEGPGRKADAAGLDTLVETLEERHEETGHARYEVSEGLREAAEAGGFYPSDGDGADGGEASYETIEVDYPREMVARILIDRPHRMNTISPDVMDELVDALDRLEADDEVRAITLMGSGDRAFSAGADVQAMATNAEPLEATNLSRKGQETFGRLEASPMPIVAGIDGYALGGGMELATCADLRVASERSELGQPEHDLGLLPGWGGTQRLRAIVGEGRAKEIIFTAERYDAEEMAEYGFVNEVVANDELEAHTLDLAEDLAAGPPVAQELTKKAMLAGRDDTEAGLEVEAQAFGHLIGTDDVMEGVMAFVNDEEPNFQGK